MSCQHQEHWLQCRRCREMRAPCRGVQLRWPRRIGGREAGGRGRRCHWSIPRPVNPHMAASGGMQAAPVDWTRIGYKGDADQDEEGQRLVGCEAQWRTSRDRWIKAHQIVRRAAGNKAPYGQSPGSRCAAAPSLLCYSVFRLYIVRKCNEQ